MAGPISSALLVEVFVGWPGLGPMFVDAIQARDFYLVPRPVMLSAAFLASSTLSAGILFYALDPRTRMEP